MSVAYPDRHRRIVLATATCEHCGRLLRFGDWYQVKAQGFPWKVFENGEMQYLNANNIRDTPSKAWRHDITGLLNCEQNSYWVRWPAHMATGLWILEQPARELVREIMADLDALENS